jgi:uncharacterized membrane protein YphA (DoxX/SURF4 family)
MNTVQQFYTFRQFVDLHHPRWIDAFRIALGIAIFIKGIYFINNSEALIEILQNSRIAGWTFIVEHHVAFTYLVGGILISIGLVTRIAIIFQLPVFFGSVFCYLTQKGFFSVFSDLAFSIIIFFLLIFFLIWGPGKFSADEIMKKEEQKNKMPRLY